MDGEGLVGLADHPALDFLNSSATPGREPIELIAGGRAYLRWLELAGMIAAVEREQARAQFAAAELDRVAGAAVALREWLRPCIAGWAEGNEAVSDDILARLNALLAAECRFAAVSREQTGRLRLSDRRRWPSADALLAPPAAAAADLFASGERGLVRQCENPSCTLWFYDRTKSHQRRWCSMAVCGNRAKARAHRARQAERGLRGAPSTR